jgi:hypothetical protein
MHDQIFRPWRNAVSISVEAHSIESSLIARVNSECKQLLTSFAVEDDRAVRSLIWRLRNAINSTLLDFDHPALGLNDYLNQIDALVSSGAEELQSSVDELLESSANPKRCFLDRVLKNENSPEPLLIWPRYRAGHPKSWPEEAVREFISDHYQGHDIHWVRHLREDMPGSVGTVFVWNPPLWRSGDDEFRLFRPFRLGFAERTILLRYFTQVKTELESPISESIFDHSEQVERVKQARNIKEQNWLWSSDKQIFEEHGREVEDEVVSTDTVDLDWWSTPDDLEIDDHMVEVLSIVTSDFERVNLPCGEIVLNDGRKIDWEDLQLDDLVAIPLRAHGLEAGTVYRHALTRARPWKSVLRDVLNELDDGVELIRQGLKEKGVNPPIALTLRKWADDGPPAAPQAKKTFLALINVLDDLTNCDDRLPDEASRLKFWELVADARATQSKKGRKQYEEDMEKLQTLLKDNPVVSPSIVDVEGGVWQLRVCRVMEARAAEAPYSSLNQFREIE